MYAHLTSTAGSDYAALSRDLTFNPGVSDPQCVNITIIDDAVVERLEFFIVEASSTGLATTTLNVIVTDNDRK